MKYSALASDSAEGHMQLATIKLLAGDYENGWEHYEHRWHWKDFTSRLPQLTVHLWCNQDLSDKTLLVVGEQGAGDIIMCSRFIPMLRAARLYLHCHKRFHGLFAGLPVTGMYDGMMEPSGELVDSVTGNTGIIPDFWVPMMSLPHRLGIRLHNIPTGPWLGVKKSVDA